MRPRCVVALTFTAAAGCSPLSQLYGGTSGPDVDATVDSDAPSDAKGSFDARTTDSNTAREGATSDAADGHASATDADSGSEGGRVTDGAAADEGGEVDADAAPTGFCAHYGAAANALFCDDFDQPGRTDLGMEGWVSINNVTPGQIESSIVVSPPNAAGLVIPLDGGAGRVAVQKTLPFASGNVSFRVAAKLQPVVGDPNAEVMMLEVGVCSFILFTGGSTLLSCPGFGVGPSATGLVEGQWNDVSLSLQRPDAGAMVFTVTVGSGPLAVTSSQTPSFNAGLGTLNVLLQFGQNTNVAVGGIYVDDVLVTSE